jgi:hypothetical protein
MSIVDFCTSYSELKVLWSERLHYLYLRNTASTWHKQNQCSNDIALVPREHFPICKWSLESYCRLDKWKETSLIKINIYIVLIIMLPHLYFLVCLYSKPIKYFNEASSDNIFNESPFAIWCYKQPCLRYATRNRAHATQSHLRTSYIKLPVQSHK